MVNVEKERQVMEDVIRTLDRHENDNLPQVQLGTTEVKHSSKFFVFIDIKSQSCTAPVFLAHFYVCLI